MCGELVKFTTKDGLVLDGFLFRSKRNNKRAILNVFGMTGNFFSSARYGALCAAAKGGGVDIFLANNRGMGVVNSFHTTGKRRWYIGTAREKFEECIFDIDGAVKFLTRQGYREIILQGHSTGCQKVTYYCYRGMDQRVKGMILLAPCDDYNLARQVELKGKFPLAVRLAKEMVRSGKGIEFTPEWISHYTAKRFLSYADPKNIEARLFDYDSKMKEFGRIRQPILTVFGSKEENLTKPVRKYMSILESRTGSSDFEWKIIAGADHSFVGKEKELARIALDWAARI
jgi:alpha-beta hydrolase superfamily lysophospholipase